MKKVWGKIVRSYQIRKVSQEKHLERKELERRAVEGANKALKEYGRVFERLAEYDRAK